MTRPQVNRWRAASFAPSDVFPAPRRLDDAGALSRRVLGAARARASNSRLTVANAAERAVEHRLVVGRHHARAQQRPSGGTAGCTATLVNTPASHSARHSSPAFQSSPTRTGTIGVMIALLLARRQSSPARARRRRSRARAARG